MSEHHDKSNRPRGNAWRRTDLDAAIRLAAHGPQSHYFDPKRGESGEWVRVEHPRLFWPGEPIPKSPTHSVMRAARRAAAEGAAL